MIFLVKYWISSFLLSSALLIFPECRYKNELLKLIYGLKSRAIDKEKINRILSYCRGNTDKMWAAKIVGLILDCDFRDSTHKLAEYFDEKNIGI